MGEKPEGGKESRARVFWATERTGLSSSATLLKRRARHSIWSRRWISASLLGAAPGSTSPNKRHDVPFNASRHGHRVRFD